MSVNPNLPAPGSAVNTDAPSGAAPSRPAANERPDDILTVRDGNGNLQRVRRADWDTATNKNQFVVVNAEPATTAAPATVTPPSPSPSPASPTVDAAQGAGIQARVFEDIKAYAARKGGQVSLADFYTFGANPPYGLGLGAVTEVRPTSPDDPMGLGLAGKRTVVKYSSGLILYADGDPAALAHGESVTPAGYGIDPTVASRKTPEQIKSETDLQAAQTQSAQAQARLEAAQAAKQEALNKGGNNSLSIREAEAQIASATAQKQSADAATDRVRAELAANTPAIQAAATLTNAEANAAQGQAALQNAATNQSRLVLDATLQEIDRRWKEGQIDNETRRILSNRAYERWQADNANTQTVMAAAGKGLEADLTERNQDIALDNTRVNAANAGFTSDVNTANSVNEWAKPGSDTAYWMLKGLQGMRKAQVQDWGGLKDVAPVTKPGVITQLGYNTPVALRSLETPDEIEQQVDDIRNGRQVRGTLTAPVTAPSVTPAAVPTVTVPKPAAQTAAPIVLPPQPPINAPYQDDQREPAPPSPAVSMAPPSPSYTTSNMLLGSSLQPVQYAQGGTPIAARDLFGRVRPTTTRYSWLG